MARNNTEGCEVGGGLLSLFVVCYDDACNGCGCYGGVCNRRE